MMMETMTRTGLRRNRRRSRSIIAQIRCISSSLSLPRENKRAVRARRSLQRIAQYMAGVMHENIVESRALHGQRFHGRVGVSRGFQEGNRGARAVVRRDSEN